MWHKRCEKCNYIKPLRAHHCSVCNRCVFLMDHHCRKLFHILLCLAWVNNCLGLENYRYFLLFILYLFIGVCYNVVTIVSIWNHHIYKQNYSLMSFILILDTALGIVLVGFNSWNWFLALTGYSTIEYWGSNTRVSNGFLTVISKGTRNTTITSRRSETTFTRPLAHTLSLLCSPPHLDTCLSQA